MVSYSRSLSLEDESLAKSLTLVVMSYSIALLVFIMSFLLVTGALWSWFGASAYCYAPVNCFYVTFLGMSSLMSIYALLLFLL